MNIDIFGLPCRAAALGLTADDIIKIDEFTENLKAVNGTARTESFFHIPSSPRRRGMGGTEVLYSSPRRDEADLPSTVSSILSYI